MTNAYSPAPAMAALMAMLPPINWIVKLRYAINLNSLFLNRSALGTMFAEAKNKLMDSSWHLSVMSFVYKKKKWAKSIGKKE